MTTLPPHNTVIINIQGAADDSSGLVRVLLPDSGMHRVVNPRSNAAMFKGVPVGKSEVVITQGIYVRRATIDVPKIGQVNLDLEPPAFDPKTNGVRLYMRKFVVTERVAWKKKVDLSWTFKWFPGTTRKETINKDLAAFKDVRTGHPEEGVPLLELPAPLDEKGYNYELKFYKSVKFDDKLIKILTTALGAELAKIVANNLKEHGNETFKTVGEILEIAQIVVKDGVKLAELFNLFKEYVVATFTGELLVENDYRVYWDSAPREWPKVMASIKSKFKEGPDDEEDPGDPHATEAEKAEAKARAAARPAKTGPANEVDDGKNGWVEEKDKMAVWFEVVPLKATAKKATEK